MLATAILILFLVLAIGLVSHLAAKLWCQSMLLKLGKASYLIHLAGLLRLRKVGQFH